MGMSLAEYAELHPYTEAEIKLIEREQATARQTAEAMRSRQRAREKAKQLIQSIQTQIEQGNAPQTILYTAITVIGLLTDSEEWATAMQSSLDAVYADIAQQSLLANEATIAAQRLEEMQSDYNGKLRQHLTRQLSGYQRIAKGLNEALDVLNQLDPQGPDPDGLLP